MMNKYKTLLLLLILLPVKIWSQPLVPSEITASETIGKYQKENYKPQTSTYNGITYWEAYLIRGFRFFFSANGNTVIIAPNGETIFTETKAQEGYSSHPIFYFPKDTTRSFIISVTNGFETYCGSTLYVIDNNYKCTQAGYLPLAPITGDYYADEYPGIETVLKIKDQGKKGIRFTFDCDSICYHIGMGNPFEGCTSSKNLYFTYVNDTLLPCPRWKSIRGVQRWELLNSIKKPYIGVQFMDINGDGQEDMYYVLDNFTSEWNYTQKREIWHCSSELILVLCKNGVETERLSFTLNYRSALITQTANGIILLEERDCYNANKQITTHNYRLQGKELIETGERE